MRRDLRKGSKQPPHSLLDVATLLVESWFNLNLGEAVIDASVNTHSAAGASDCGSE
jgi:hypothetical protein